MEKPKDRDFIETVEGLLFCVVGYLHPPDWYTAYLKYIPSWEGRWSREETRYDRVLPYYHVSQVEKTYDYLLKRHPQYIYRCPVRNITISSIPRKYVKAYYHPRDRLQSMLAEGPRDRLEQKLEGLAYLMADLSGLETGDLGVTGSLLTGNHNPKFSDMDITVYGQRASRKLKESILEAREKSDEILPLSKEKKMEWSRSRAERFPLKFEELMELAEKRWNYGTYEGVYFSIHPTRVDQEIEETYGDYKYRQVCRIEGEAGIKDASEAIYLPAKYCLDSVGTETKMDVTIEEIVSFEGLFGDAFEAGDRIRFRGTLEHVTGLRAFHRVIVGGAGSRLDFIKRI
ncbi:MAG: hypothetical protein JSV18_05960 [Candidatus Bathyarchaeota archaeon]|nr:MAG: hypothetical protein JSV18_05960 [Candidatus Bathyarchaeota archaeon]